MSRRIKLPSGKEIVCKADDPLNHLTGSAFLEALAKKDKDVAKEIKDQEAKADADKASKPAKTESGGGK